MSDTQLAAQHLAQAIAGLRLAERDAQRSMRRLGRLFTSIAARCA